MKNSIDHHIFRKGASKFTASTSLVAAFALIITFGYSCNFNIKDKSTQKITKEKLSKSKNYCEFGLEGSLPVEAKELDACLTAISDLGAGTVINQFFPEHWDSLSRQEEFG